MQILFSTHGCEWVNVFFWYQVTRVVLDKVPLNGLCVCVSMNVPKVLKSFSAF